MVNEGSLFTEQDVCLNGLAGEASEALKAG